MKEYIYLLSIVTSFWSIYLFILEPSCFLDLMREPVLQDKRLEHVKFCKYASALIETVSGKTQNSTIDASLEKIRKVKYRVFAPQIHINAYFLLKSFLI